MEQIKNSFVGLWRSVVFLFVTLWTVVKMTVVGFWTILGALAMGFYFGVKLFFESIGQGFKEAGLKISEAFKANWAKFKADLAKLGKDARSEADKL